MPEHVLDLEAIKAHARHELQQNWTGEYFAPHHEGAFPDNFLWDTCFVAMGLAEDEPELAAELLLELKNYQWTNGMFANQNVDKRRSGTLVERLNFQTDKSTDAPEDTPTSGFSQPPMLAEATLTVARQLSSAKQQAFLDEMLPSIIRYHEWLFDHRDINGDGLVAQIHPYETGMDNTPPLEMLAMDSRTARDRFLTGKFMMGVFGSVIDAMRRDFKHAPRGHRMHNSPVSQYFLLTRKLTAAGYDIDRIVADPTIPLVEDVTYNSIFMRANKQLRELAELAETVLPERLQSQIDRQKTALDQLWDSQHQAYFTRNARTKELLKIKTIGSLMPLYATELDTPRRHILISDLTDPTQFWTPHPVPSMPLTPTHHHDGRILHDPERYWAGPAWTWMNSILTIGLDQNHEHGLANTIRHRTLANADRLRQSNSRMAYEYYHAVTGEGLGVYPFSAAAAKLIHLANKAAEPDAELAKAVY